VSALDNLLDEVRLEAEQAVRTEYENTVIELRSKLTATETALATATSEWEKWRAEAKKSEDRLIKAADKLEKLAATL
jgi:hypothetical protein